MRRFFGSLALGAMLCTPAILSAQEHHDRDKDNHRYYDSYKRDYHEWNENENNAWRHWIEAERHGRYHDWDKASRKEQREYWRWRHEHPDWH